jgi:hypothetical protein
MILFIASANFCGVHVQQCQVRSRGYPGSVRVEILDILDIALDTIQGTFSPSGFTTLLQSDRGVRSVQILVQ